MDFSRVGILGGTFNPIHNGHLLLAENAFDTFKLNKVLFMPTGDPPHKDNKIIVSKERRLRMIELAIEDNHHFDVSTIEMDRLGTTYTIDTLNYLKEQNPNYKYYFIIGADTLEQLLNWKNYSNVFNLCEFIVAQRDHYVKKNILNIKKDLENNNDAKIHWLPMPKIDLSSSEIRKRINQGNTIKYMVPKDIEHYIYLNNLYKKLI